MKLLLPFFLFVFCDSIYSQTNTQSQQFTISEYQFNIFVKDATDSIFGEALLKIQPKGIVKQVQLNLKNLNREGKGMIVQMVMDNVNNVIIPFTHRNNLLTITTERTPYSISIIYKGIPADGLVIGKNKFGARTWFGDNWPNRAQCWLPCIDHPSAKATIRWTVTCPAQYMVTANGVLVQEINLENNKQWIFEENNPIPMKVAVIGIAKMQKKCLVDKCFTVCNLFYPETFKKQPAKMDDALEIVKFFSATIGDYPFQKLNNVQSTTAYGGMENADNIFYDENRVDGEPAMEDLIAHEIAHQWFGNTVTEKDFSHIWLSEGFATFFTNYYMEKKYGVAVFKERIKNDWQNVQAYLSVNKKPVIDSTTDYKSLLNPNSYEKGGLFLQALRVQLGDAIFFTGIRNYFNTYKYKNATTNDFRTIMEQTSKKDLKAVFNKWLYTAALPNL